MSTGGRGGDRPTIYDVATRAGVSKSLVSLVLRGSDRVSPVRRQAVQAAIDELGYRPSRAATMLASRRTRTVEVAIDDYRNLWFVELIEGLRHVLTPNGYHLSVSDRTVPVSGQPAGVAAMVTGTDGLVMARDPGDGMLAGWQGPTVVAGWRAGVISGADLVANDDETGSRLAVEHLWRLGHRSIAHLSGEGGSAGHRRDAFAAEMRDRHRPVVVATGGGGTTEEDGYRAALNVLQHHRGVSAIYAANDSMAVGALAAAAELGVVVPRDISVVGYDNSPFAQSRLLALTSVDARSREVGQAAGEALLARMQDRSRPATRLLIEPTLVVRGSSGPPPPGH